MDDIDNMYQGKPHTQSNIEWLRPQSSTSRHEEELIQQSLRALEHATDPLEKLRLLCLSKGASGIMGLVRIFRRMDANDSKQLKKEEFIHGIKETGLEFSEKDAEELFNRYEIDESGLMDLNEFLVQIQPPMSEYRRHIVEQAFKKLDKKGEGVISIADIKAVYAVTSNQRYMSGEETAEKTMGMFLATFETKGTIVDGTVTLEDFMNYYNGISVSIDKDCYFDLMLRQEYRL